MKRAPYIFITIKLMTMNKCVDISYLIETFNLIKNDCVIIYLDNKDKELN